MPAIPITIQTIGPHDAQNHSVKLTAKLITARWNQKLKNLKSLREQLGEFENCGGLDHWFFKKVLEDHHTLAIQAVEDLDDAELTALHKVLGEHLVKAVTADIVVEIIHPNKDAHGDPVVPPLVVNMIESHDNVPKNYAGILLLDVAKLFYAPVSENEMAQYVRRERGLVS